jgi:ribonuclease HI
MYAATVLVDASWCPDTGAAGYGYWIASDRGKIGGGHPMKGKLSSSNIAEMQAVCSALFIVQQIGYLLPTERVLIQTDSEAAIQAFMKKREVSIDCEKHAVKVYQNLSRGIEVNFRHIKGHTSRGEPRYLSNKHCDRQAKRAMAQARKELHEIETNSTRKASRKA